MDVTSGRRNPSGRFGSCLRTEGGRKRMGSIVSFVDFFCSGLGISLFLKRWFAKFSLVFFWNYSSFWNTTFFYGICRGHVRALPMLIPTPVVSNASLCNRKHSFGSLIFVSSCIIVSKAQFPKPATKDRAREGKGTPVGFRFSWWRGNCRGQWILDQVLFRKMRPGRISHCCACSSIQNVSGRHHASKTRKNSYKGFKNPVITLFIQTRARGISSSGTTFQTGYMDNRLPTHRFS